tara:strand:+ start:111 stop:698 length:588 start_codon:yes stop_codon:yes gene_type:complete
VITKVTDKIILASKSPRRKQLLRQIDFDFKVVPSKIDEDLSLKLKPFLFVEHYANLKAQNVANKYQNSWVIGADTIVALNEKIFGKPKDKNESYSMLKELSGNTHNVFTGISIHHQNKDIRHTFHEKTLVEFKTLTDSCISYYINTYNTLDKAGSYGIQDWLSVFIKRIDGCFYNVMGLPLAKFYEEFSALNELR